MGVDWTWTFPAVGVPLFVILGIGLTSEARLGRRSRTLVGVAALGLAVLAFAPPYLSARLTTQGLQSREPSQLTWAARLDPLSTAPDIARYGLAATPAERLQIAARLVRRRPRAIAFQYLLGESLLAVGRRAAAREAFTRALALHPGDKIVAAALARSK